MSSELLDPKDVLAQFDIGFSDAALEADELAAQKANASKIISKLPVGKSRFRFLPQRGGAVPWTVVHQHFITLPGQQKALRIICPRMHEQRECRVCTAATRLMASRNPIEAQRGEKMQAQRNLNAFVIDRDNEEMGVRVLVFRKQVHDQLRAFRDAKNGAGKDFVHPTNGRDIIIVRTGTSQESTEYKVMMDDPGPIHKDTAVMARWLSEVPDLKSLVRVPSDSDIEDMLNGRKPQRMDRGSLASPLTQAVLSAGSPTAAARVASGRVEDFDPDND